MKRSIGVWLALLFISLAPEISSGRTIAPQEFSGEFPGMVVLPPKVIAGEPETLAVLDDSGRLVPGAAVEIAGTGRITTDATGRGTFIASSQLGTMTVRLQNGSEFVTLVIPKPTEPASQRRAAGSPPAGAAQIVLPRVIALGNRLVIEGSGFRGQAGLNGVLIGDQPALILAASPVALVALPNPRTPIGSTELAVEADGHSLGRAPVSVISLIVMGPAKTLATDEKGFLVTAVNGTAERLVVEVQNLSPDVLELAGGETVRLTTSGGASNLARVEVEGVQPGEYAVSARVLTERMLLQEAQEDQEDQEIEDAR